MRNVSFGWVGLFLLLLVGAPATADETPSEGQIAAWIQALEDDDYATRVAAGKRLAAAGRAAIAPLAKALGSNSPEAAWRASDVLEQIGLLGDEQTLELVSQTLEAASLASKGSSAQAQSQVRKRWKTLRHERAVEQVSKLGGKVRRMAEFEDGRVFFGGGFGGMLVPAIAIEDSIELIEIEPEPPAKPEGSEPEPAPDVEPPADAPKFADDPFGDPEPAAPAAAEERPAAAPADLLKILPGGGILGPVKIEFLPGFEPPAAPPRREAPEPLLPEIDLSLDPPDAPRVGRLDKLFRALADILPGGEGAAPVLREIPGVALPDLEMPLELDGIEIVAEPFEFVEGGAAILLDDPFLEVFDHGFEGEAGQAHAVALGKNWRGGAEGLKHLKDILQLASLELADLEVTEDHVAYISGLAELRQLNLQRCRFDRVAVERLKKNRPDLHVLAFGNAVLGVSGEAQPAGFHVSFVAPESGAQVAGIEVEDTIVAIDGEDVGTFERLTHIVASHAAGDKVSVSLLRDGKRRTVEATLKAREAQPRSR